MGTDGYWPLDCSHSRNLRGSARSDRGKCLVVLDMNLVAALTEKFGGHPSFTASNADAVKVKHLLWVALQTDWRQAASQAVAPQAREHVAQLLCVTRHLTNEAPRRC